MTEWPEMLNFVFEKSKFMACNPDFIQYIIDQCSGAGEIAVKKMMGDYGSPAKFRGSLPKDLA